MISGVYLAVLRPRYFRIKYPDPLPEVQEMARYLGGYGSTWANWRNGMPVDMLEEYIAAAPDLPWQDGISDALSDIRAFERHYEFCPDLGKIQPINPVHD